MVEKKQIVHKGRHRTITIDGLQVLFTEIARSITSSLELSKIIEAIMKQVQQFFQPRNWSLFRLDPVTQDLYFVVASGIDEKAVKKIRIKLGEGVAGRVALTGKSMLVEDTRKNPFFTNKIDKISGFETKSIVAVPIVFHKQVLGVIELINAIQDNSFNRQDVMLLQTIANFSAIAMMNSSIYERMTLLAVSDHLTGLYNRTQLQKILHSFKVRVNKNKRKLDNSYVIAVWIDIDNFKKINDKHGHKAGDEILQKSATLIKGCCRANDFAFRVGGDEFLLLIMNLKNKDIPSIKKRLSERLRYCSDQITPAGFSFGIASSNMQQLSGLISKADKKMYIDKKNKKVARK